MKSTTHRVIKLVVVGILSIFFAACAGEDVLPHIAFDDADDDVAPQQVFETRVGSLLAEFKYPRHESYSHASDDNNLLVQAQFLDIMGVPVDGALDALDVWTPDYLLDVDSCTLKSGGRGSSMALGQDNVSLYLLDVGTIHIQGPQESIELRARYLPDLLSTFSGVFYSNEPGVSGDDLAIEYYPGERYYFSAPGSESLSGFFADIVAPEPLYIERISNITMHNRTHFDYTYGDALDIEWHVDPNNRSNDDIFLEISSGFGPEKPRLLCRVSDSGSFSVPSSVMERLSENSSVLDLSLRRIQWTDVAIEELDHTEFIIAISDELKILVD